jgi:hypothetical protein
VFLASFAAGALGGAALLGAFGLRTAVPRSVTGVVFVLAFAVSWVTFGSRADVVASVLTGSNGASVDSAANSP